MGCRIFVGHECGSDREQAYLWCSTTERCFGPAFESEEDADAFLEWCERDPRRYTEAELERQISVWEKHRAETAKGNLACDVCDEYFPEAELADADGNFLCDDCRADWHKVSAGAE